MDTYEFRDPAQLVRNIAEQVRLTEDTAYVALVAHPSTEQRVVSVEQLRTPALIDDYTEAIEEIRTMMAGLVIPGASWPPTHSVITVLARPGLCVVGPNEGCWMRAWSYSNHLRECFSGGVLLVTEHGWCDFMTESAGHFPALAA